MINDIEKEEIIHKRLEKEYKIDFTVKLRVLDPRVNSFSCYAELSNNDINNIIANHSDAKTEKDGASIISIYYSIPELSTDFFTRTVSIIIYNATNSRIKDLIEKHDKEYEEKKENTKNMLL